MVCQLIIYGILYCTLQGMVLRKIFVKIQDRRWRHKHAFRSMHDWIFCPSFTTTVYAKCIFYALLMFIMCEECFKFTHHQPPPHFHNHLNLCTSYTYITAWAHNISTSIVSTTNNNTSVECQRLPFSPTYDDLTTATATATTTSTTAVAVVATTTCQQ